MVRPARDGDLPALRDVERAAGALFLGVGMDAVADDEPLSVAALAAYQRDGRAWVAAGEGDVPVACLLVDVVDEPMTDGLRRLRDHEVTTVLASWPRVAMRRAVR